MRKSAAQFSRELYVALSATPEREHRQIIHGFLKSLALSRRSGLKSRIVDAFARLALAAEGKTAGTITTAREIDASTRRKSAKQSPDVAFDYAAQTDLVGGAVIRVGDTMLDGSVRGRLDRLRQTLVH